MTHHDGLSEWTQQVSSNLPQLSKPQARGLAWWSYGIVLMRTCGRTTVATFLAVLLGKKAATVAQRLREWCYEAEAKAGVQRQTLVVQTCFAPLLAWVLRLWSCSTTLALAMDATTLDSRFAVLAVTVVYRGCAIPVAWAIVPQQQKGTWRQHWLRLLRLLRPAIPRGWTVIVLADRGLYASWLFRRIVRLGWHPFLRVRPAFTFRPAGKQRFYAMRDLVPQVGRHWAGSGVAFRTRHSRLDCTLLAYWDERCTEAWCVLTDLAPAAAEVLWYGLRSWCEQGFKVLKRGAWQWQHTRMRDPARAERLWLALAVATLWMLSVGGELENDLTGLQVPALTELLLPPGRGRARTIRLVRLALMWLLVCLLHGVRFPMPSRLTPDPWPERPAWPALPPLLEAS
jgi:Transposase DDE domain